LILFRIYPEISNFSPKSIYRFIRI